MITQDQIVKISQDFADNADNKDEYGDIVEDNERLVNETAEILINKIEEEVKLEDK